LPTVELDHQGIERRVEALARASAVLRAHVETLTQVSTALLAHVESLDGEVSALTESLRAGREAARSEEEHPPAPTPAAAPVPVAAVLAPGLAPTPTPTLAPAATAPEPAPQAGGSRQGGDLDGARLVALNMALGGEPREQIDRYLAKSFQLADRTKLLDEVYAAVEG
jgi:hypothetical protein